MRGKGLKERISAIKTELTIITTTAMTIDKREMIQIPRFWVIIAAPLLVALLTSLLTVTTAKAKMETRLTYQEQETKRLFETKTDRTENALILRSLERIEKKLDDHIANGKK